MPPKDSTARLYLRVARAATAIREQPDPPDVDRAYLARQLVQATLPHRNPGDIPIWKRTNGLLTVSIQPGWDLLKDRSFGHPYGSIPRLLLFWLTTEAKRTGSRHLELGESMADFMREIGLDPWTGGGPRGDARRLRDQIQRLFQARISFVEHVREGSIHGQTWLNMEVAPKGQLWWDYKRPGQPVLFGSWIELGEHFYQAITAAPVPLDMRALAALKQSPLALDLYSWIAYRSFTVTRSGAPVTVSWPQLMQQIGTGYADAKNFKRKTKEALRKVRAIYPKLKVEDVRGGLKLSPGVILIAERP
jgi:hypothetical protein